MEKYNFNKLIVFMMVHTIIIFIMAALKFAEPLMLGFIVVGFLIQLYLLLKELFA